MIPNDMLIHTCTILTRGGGFNSSTGQRDNTWSTAASNVRCRRDSLKYSRYVSQTGDREKVTDVILFNESSSVSFLVKDNQVQIGSEVFRIMSKKPMYEPDADFKGNAVLDHYEVEVLLIQ